MPENFDGEYELRIFYTTTPNTFPVLGHVHTMDVRVTETPSPGQLFSAIEVGLASGSLSTLAAQVDIYVAYLQPMFDVDTDINRAELWYIAEGTTNGIFISSYVIAENGTNVADARPANQSTWTFRTVGGGVMRLQLMETSDTTVIKVAYPTGNAAINALFDFIVGPASMFLARDNTRPFSPLNYAGGQNEALARKRYRSL